MTPTQKRKHNEMIDVLRSISNDFQTPEQLYKNSTRDFYVNYTDALEMAYENIQILAKRCLKNARKI